MKNFINWLRMEWGRDGLVAFTVSLWLVVTGIAAFLILLNHLLLTGAWGSITSIWIGVPVMFVLIAYILRSRGD